MNRDEVLSRCLLAFVDILTRSNESHTTKLAEQMVNYLKSKGVKDE